MAHRQSRPRIVSRLTRWTLCAGLLVIVATLLLAIGMRSAQHRDRLFRAMQTLRDALGLHGWSPAEKQVMVFYANDFSISFVPLPHLRRTEMTGGLLSSATPERLEVFEQDDIEKLWKSLRIAEFVPNAEPAVDRNHGYYGGIKKAFRFNGQLFALVSLKSDACYFASILNLTARLEVFRAPCLPEPEMVEYRSIGGGTAELEGNLLFALGTPSVNGAKTVALAQDPRSPYGKVLQFTKESLATRVGPDAAYEVFSSGHRNIQGMLNVGGNIYAVEHGPKGGDEINHIRKGRNYGWPDYSLGSTYEGVPYATVGDTARFEPPLYTFIPAAAISDLVRCPDAMAKRYQPYVCLLISSLRGMSLYVTLIESSQHRVISVERIETGMRLREFAKGTPPDQIYVSADLQGLFELTIRQLPNTPSPAAPKPAGYPRN